MEAPQTLYYTTVLFADGGQQTPPYFVFDKLPEGVSMLRRYYSETPGLVESFIIKQLELVGTKVLPEEAMVIIPHTDDTIVEESDPESHEKNVQVAEEGDPAESIMLILPEEQEASDLLCRAFYMGSFRRAASIDDFVNSLINDPIVAATPLDYVWLYRPTGEMKSIKA